MTSPSVDDDANPNIIAREHPSLLRIWWANKKLHYDIVMGTILIILNIAVFVYVKHYKISLTGNQEASLIICVFFYIMFGLVSSCSWWIAISEAGAYDMYIVGRVTHIFGLSILLQLLYPVSPSLALWFGIPSSLWFLAAFSVALYTLCLRQCLEECGKYSRDWWIRVNEPQVTFEGESPSLLRTWCANKKLHYDIVMGTILIILNIAAFVYVKHHKISLTEDQVELLRAFVMIFVIFGIVSCICWCIAITNVAAYDMYLMGRFCHIFGLAVLLQLLYPISPSLALWFGIPSSLWFLAAFFVALYTLCLRQCLEECGKDSQDWWERVNEPQVTFDYV